MGDREELQKFIALNISSIRQRWHELVLASYPPETAKLLGSQKNQFANPVGHTLKTTIDDVLEGLGKGVAISEIASAFHNLIRIKAVQGFTPADAVSSVLMLKQTVREHVAAGSSDNDGVVLKAVDPIIDELLCSCFNLYVDCRQKLSDIKEDELKRNLFMLLKKSDAVDVQGNG